MTILAGFCARDGVLICSDTQYTSGAKIYDQKIFTEDISGDPYIFGLAGHEPNGKMALSECREAIRKLLPKDKRTAHTVMTALRKAIKPICDEYVLARPQSEQGELAFQFLIGCWIPNGEGHKLFVTTSNGAVNQVDQYSCLGTGAYLGEFLIRPSYDVHMNMAAVRLLGARALGAAKYYDQSCGGPSQSFSIAGGKLFGDSFDIFAAEKFARDFEVSSQSLMLSIADATSSKVEFEYSLDSFINQVRHMREERLNPEAPPSPPLPTGGS